MNALPDDLQALIDDYLVGDLDEPRLRELEARLVADADARHHFVRYCQMGTQLHLEMRAQRAGDAVLRQIAGRFDADSPVAETGSAGGRRWSTGVIWALAASLLAAVAAGWWWLGTPPSPTQVAWLANAQNCRWADGVAPAGDLRPGHVVALQSGLAELHFQSGAQVVLEGPAQLELLSWNTARLLRGRLTAHVPETARGFQVLSPQGKVVDLGTEFGLSVDDSGAADVVVFAGRVEAQGRLGAANAVSLTEPEAARIGADGVAVQTRTADAAFVRAIVPPPVIVRRTLTLDFRQPMAGTLGDRFGLGTGLTHRLSGTGGRLAANDANLRLDSAAGHLELATTNSDINTQYLLDHGEYLGVRLSDLGFTGREDFEVTVSIPDIPSLRELGQFGLYAGTRSDQNIRGGLISRREPGQYTQFLVNNNGGRDSDAHYLGVTPSGDDMRLTLRRSGGRYALTVEDRSASSTSTLTIQHPAFLDDARDLFVGVFGANTQSTTSQTLTIKELKINVWTVKSP